MAYASASVCVYAQAAPLLAISTHDLVPQPIADRPRAVVFPVPQHGVECTRPIGRAVLIERTWICWQQTMLLNYSQSLLSTHFITPLLSPFCDSWMRVNPMLTPTYQPQNLITFELYASA